MFNSYVVNFDKFRLPIDEQAFSFLLWFGIVEKLVTVYVERGHEKLGDFVLEDNTYIYTRIACQMPHLYCVTNRRLQLSTWPKVTEI